MSRFFQNFPLTSYKFGNESTATRFQNISVYIKLIDEISNDIAFYSTVHIQDYDRPDSLSFKLYRNIDFYWTFYYLNTDIRESGWPLPEQDLLKKAKVDYPHRVLKTTGDISKTFLPGHQIQIPETLTGGAPNPEFQLNGHPFIVKRYLDLGQIILNRPIFNDTSTGLLNKFTDGQLLTPIVNGTKIGADEVLLKSDVEQYNSVHHYENSSKEFVDIGLVPSGQGANDYPTVSSFTPVTYFERIRAKNDSLREIKVLKPSVAIQIQNEFNRLVQDF